MPVITALTTHVRAIPAFIVILAAIIQSVWLLGIAIHVHARREARPQQHRRAHLAKVHSRDFHQSLKDVDGGFLLLVDRYGEAGAPYGDHRRRSAHAEG